jgi:hypothetical protein
MKFKKGHIGTSLGGTIIRLKKVKKKALPDFNKIQIREFKRHVRRQISTNVGQVTIRRQVPDGE